MNSFTGIFWQHLKPPSPCSPMYWRKPPSSNFEEHPYIGGGKFSTPVGNPGGLKLFFIINFHKFHLSSKKRPKMSLPEICYHWHKLFLIPKPNNVSLLTTMSFRILDYVFLLYHCQLRSKTKSDKNITISVSINI